MKKKESIFKKLGLPVPRKSDINWEDASVPDNIYDQADSELSKQMVKWIYLSNIAYFHFMNYRRQEINIRSSIKLKQLRIKRKCVNANQKRKEIEELRIKIDKVKGLKDSFLALHKIYDNNYKVVSRVVSIRVSERSRGLAK